MSNHLLGQLLALVMVVYSVLFLVAFNLWYRRRVRHLRPPTNLYADPEAYLRYQIPPLIVAEAGSFVAGASVWPLSLLETDVGRIPYYNLAMGLGLLGIIALFVALDVMLILRARREMRRQRSAMR